MLPSPRKLAKSDYPFLLRQISKLPETMDIIGEMPSDDHRFLCVVGSRHYSKYGEEACRKLISGLANYPIVIVSGLAIGIDSIAHQAALEAGLKTVSFPGSGLSKRTLYPKRHYKLACEIVAKGGALVSPFEYDQDGTEWTFPTRNRLMAGMSHGILIIEAGRGSGTLLTAGYAEELNRDLYVVPGSIFEEHSYGPHMLLRRGGVSVSSSIDLLESLGFEVYRKNNANGQATLPLAPPELTDDESLIYKRLQFSPASSSDLIASTAMSITKLNIIISLMEVRGIVEQRDGVYRVTHN